MEELVKFCIIPPTIGGDETGYTATFYPDAGGRKELVVRFSCYGGDSPFTVGTQAIYHLHDVIAIVEYLGFHENLL